MPESFGNSLLGVVITALVVWAFFEPQGAGQWIAEFRHGMTGGYATQIDSK